MSGSNDGELTRVLRSLRAGDAAALEQVFGLVYAELHRLAEAKMAGEKAGHTLQPTALVNEAYLRLVDQSELSWQNRAHFFALAARAMRQILVDHARRRGAEKRGGELRRVTLDEALDAGLMAHDFDVIDLDDALRSLSAEDEQLGRLVELRFFAGLTLEETAEALGLSRRKVAGDWAFARSWLARELA